MKTHEKRLHEDNLEKELLPLLRENIFHVTSHASFQGIMTSKYIRSNKDGEFPFTFPQSINNYGRKRGYVCLFDLREKNEIEIKNALDCFYFLGPRQLGNKVVFLILNHNYHGILVSNKTEAIETEYREMLIPRAECWYPGDLPVENISEAIIVSIRRRPKSDLVKILEKIDGEEKYKL